MRTASQLPWRGRRRRRRTRRRRRRRRRKRRSGRRRRRRKRWSPPRRFRRGGGDQLVDLGNVRADAEEWQEVNFDGEVTSEVNYRRVSGSNYRSLKVAVWPYKYVFKFTKKGDYIIVYAPEGVYAHNIQRRFLEASSIDFLRKIREDTYEYVE